MDSDTMDAYYKIYDRLYEDPFISDHNLAACTGIPESKISQYVQTMYESSILFGPLIFLKPSQNRRRYTYFLLVDYPLEVYKHLSTWPHIVNKTLCAGIWNLLVITEVEMDFSVLKEFKKCVHQGLKGGTWLSRVTTQDWDASMKVEDVLHPPEKKSFLLQEVPDLDWGEKEWTLYHTFKFNVRADPEPILESCNISRQVYQQWISELPKVAVIQPAFYPYGIYAYSVLQFLFKSQYHHQLASILGMLPRTTVFFSTGDYLMARIHVGTEKEVDDLFSLVFKLKGEYFTNFMHVVIVTTYSPKRQK